MNLEMFEKVKAWMRQYPERVDMREYFARDDLVGLELESLATLADETSSNWCGTTACIAGIAILLGIRAGIVAPETIHGSPMDAPLHVAARVLNIGEDAALMLFFEFNWTKELNWAYACATSQRGRADIMCKAIDQFIAGGGTGEFKEA